MAYYQGDVVRILQEGVPNVGAVILAKNGDDSFNCIVRSAAPGKGLWGDLHSNLFVKNIQWHGLGRCPEDYLGSYSSVCFPISCKVIRVDVTAISSIDEYNFCEIEPPVRIHGMVDVASFEENIALRRMRANTSALEEKLGDLSQRIDAASLGRCRCALLGSCSSRVEEIFEVVD